MGGSKKCSSRNGRNSSLVLYCLEASDPHTVPVGSGVRMETILVVNHRWWNLPSGAGAQGGQKQTRESRETMTAPFLVGVGKVWETLWRGTGDEEQKLETRKSTTWGMEVPQCITHKSRWPPPQDLTDALPLPSFNSAFPTVLSGSTTYIFWASFSLFWSTREEETYIPSCPSVLLFIMQAYPILMFHRDFFFFLLLSQVIIIIQGIKCFPHKCHPSIFHFHLEDTNNVPLANGKIVVCTFEQRASLRLSRRVLPSRWSRPGTPREKQMEPERRVRTGSPVRRLE